MSFARIGRCCSSAQAVCRRQLGQRHDELAGEVVQQVRFAPGRHRVDARQSQAIAAPTTTSST